MKKALPLLVVLLVPAPALAQQDWREELSSELVTVTDGRFSYEEYAIVSLNLPNYQPVEFQVKLSSDGPADGTISRDNFVAVTSTVATLWLLTTFSQWYNVPVADFFAGYNSKELDAPIGTPDIELNLRMTGEGMQMEFVNTQTDQKSRTVWTWDEFYGG